MTIPKGLDEFDYWAKPAVSLHYTTKAVIQTKS